MLKNKNEKDAAKEGITIEKKRMNFFQTKMKPEPICNIIYTKINFFTFVSFIRTFE